MRRLALLLALPACAATVDGSENESPVETVEVIVTADGTVECIRDGEISSSDLRGC